MSTIRGLIKGHPLTTYFALAFAISWAGVLAVVGPSGIPGTTEGFEARLVYVVLAMLAGPSVACLLSTALLQGMQGFRELLSRLVNWRVGTRWYLIALMTGPLVVATTLFSLSLFSPVFLSGITTTNQPVPHLLLGIATGLGAGIFEELGWTGFALPWLRRHYSVLATGLILGLLWGAWHLIVIWWGSGSSSGAVSIAVYLPVMAFSFLPPYRLLMVWVYDRTESLHIAMLMHASLTASVRIFDPLAIAGAPLLYYQLVLATVLWVIVATVAVANWGQFSRQLDLARARSLP
jgi:uncharacterized protein